MCLVFIAISLLGFITKSVVFNQRHCTGTENKGNNDKVNKGSDEAKKEEKYNVIIKTGMIQEYNKVININSKLRNRREINEDYIKETKK